MMDFWQILALALVQGLTEFLPISSSAHLVLVPGLLGWADQGLAFDIAVHVGTLTAVVTYFRHQLASITRDWGQSLRQRRPTGDSRLAWAVILGTIPVGLTGLLLSDVVEQQLRSTLVIAVTTLLFGVLLGWADLSSKHARSEYQIRWSDVLVIGCAQALALIPGTSRSGITITAGLFLGLTRQGAARFSFLLSIPVIALAGVHKLSSLLNSTETIDWGALIGGVIISGISAYVCIHFFLKLLERVGMMPFVIYRVILGGLLLFLSL